MVFPEFWHEQMKMLSGCRYEELESILPPQLPTNAQNSYDYKGKIYTGIPTRLEYISASVIMHDEDITRCILPLIPAKLFQPLLQAAICNIFYNEDHGLEYYQRESLALLILQWPYESFVLREVLPPLPPTNFKRWDQLLSVKDALGDFYENILWLFPQAVLKSRIDITSTEEWEFFSEWYKHTYERHFKCNGLFNSPLKRIDVSGYNHNFSNETILTPKYLLGFVKASYNPSCPPGNDKLELIYDVFIPAHNKENLNALGIIAEISSQPGANLIVIFRKVAIQYIKYNDIALVTSLLKTLYKNGTEWLELSLECIDDKIVTHFYPQLQGLHLSLCTLYTQIKSLAFLNNMSNLQHLYLSGMKKLSLTNKLVPLCCLPRGLEYLMLVDCGLRGEDMKVLEQSHHVKTLLHLDISDNNFALPTDASGLIGFCKVLVSVEILNIQGCCLNKLTPDLLGKLLESLATLPKLSLLILSDNDFPSRLLCNYIKVLNTCMPLRCVFLTVPSDLLVRAESVQTRVQDLQNEVYSEINCNRKTILNVTWTIRWEDTCRFPWSYRI